MLQPITSSEHAIAVQFVRPLLLCVWVSMVQLESARKLGIAVLDCGQSTQSTFLLALITMLCCVYIDCQCPNTAVVSMTVYILTSMRILLPC